MLETADVVDIVFVIEAIPDFGVIVVAVLEEESGRDTDEVEVLIPKELKLALNTEVAWHVANDSLELVELGLFVGNGDVKELKTKSVRAVKTVPEIIELEDDGTSLDVSKADSVTGIIAGNVELLEVTTSKNDDDEGLYTKGVLAVETAPENIELKDGDTNRVVSKTDNVASIVELVKVPTSRDDDTGKVFDNTWE
jgi:hypothetical protein